MSSEKRVAVLVAEGLEECEALIPVDMLYRAGVKADLVAVGSSLEVTSSHEIKLVCDKSLADPNFDISAYELLFLPGGMPGTQHLWESEAVLACIDKAREAGLKLAAICAAPYVLARQGLLQGKKATSNPSWQEKVAAEGAEVQADSLVVKDGDILTSQGMGTAMELGFSLIELLLDKEAVEKVKSGIVYRYC